MTRVVTQALPQALPAPGFGGHDASGNLGLTNRGLQAASFTASGNSSYLAPVGGTVTLPPPRGSGAFIALSIFGAGVCTLSGTLSVGGAVVSSYLLVGGQTLLIADADPTQGWC